MHLAKHLQLGPGKLADSESDHATGSAADYAPSDTDTPSDNSDSESESASERHSDVPRATLNQASAPRLPSARNRVVRSPETGRVRPRRLSLYDLLRQSTLASEAVPLTVRQAELSRARRERRVPEAALSALVGRVEGEAVALPSPEAYLQRRVQDAEAPTALTASTAECARTLMPSSALLTGVHHQASVILDACFGSTSQNRLSILDETALLAFGLFLEEAAAYEVTQARKPKTTLPRRSMAQSGKEELAPLPVVSPAMTRVSPARFEAYDMYQGDALQAAQAEAEAEAEAEADAASMAAQSARFEGGPADLHGTLPFTSPASFFQSEVSEQEQEQDRARASVSPVPPTRDRGQEHFRQRPKTAPSNPRKRKRAMGF